MSKRFQPHSRRVLIVPDAFWGGASGAAAARVAGRVWAGAGFDVGVFAGVGPTSQPIDDQQVRFFSRGAQRVSHHLWGGAAAAQFSAVLDEFRPAYAFFLGNAISKPARFFRSCASRGIPTIGFWWTQDFFCSRGYGCLPGGPCKLCVRANYFHAVVNRCGYGRAWLRQVIGGTLARLALRRALIRTDVAMASTTSQLDLLAQFGFHTSKLVLCPLFFDRARVASGGVGRGDYFVCYGQARMEKGWHLLAEIVKRSSPARFVLPFETTEGATRAVEQFDLGDLIEQGRIELKTGISWNTGVSGLVAGARGVLIPSIWPTTTEYTLLESLGLGKPVVVFGVGIHAEALRSRVSALVANVGDVGQMAANVAELAVNDELYDRLSGGAREAFEELTSIARYQSSLLKALDIVRPVA